MKASKEYHRLYMQRRRKARREAGLCYYCDSPARADSAFCEVHRQQTNRQAREHRRRTKGFKPWRPGGKGRPPLDGARNEEGLPPCT
jgi:hypothetical protein